jgi:hypothetical protein
VKLSHIYLPPGIRVVITLGDLPPKRRDPEVPANDIHDPVRIEIFERGDLIGQMEMRRSMTDGDSPEEFIEMTLENHPRPGPRLVE